MRSFLRALLRRARPGAGAGAPGTGLWIDAPDAMQTLERARVPEGLKSMARALREDGIAVVRGAHKRALCRELIADYERYVLENRDYVLQNLDPLGREKRLVNFHLWSDAAARIGTAPVIMQALDFVFGTETGVYTSLTFKYGTQQPVHRDTPHFATWPRNRFVGVWTALEDVSASAGPLFYHRGGHRFAVDPQPFMEQASARLPQASLDERLALALDLYNGEVIRRSPAVAPATALELRAGDTVIWHPELPHGGLPAVDPSHTRWSIVFHCAPVDTQVHQHDRFFTHSLTAPPAPRYGFAELHERKIAQAGGVAFM